LTPNVCTAQENRVWATQRSECSPAPALAPTITSAATPRPLTSVLSGPPALWCCLTVEKEGVTPKNRHLTMTIL